MAIHEGSIKDPMFDRSSYDFWKKRVREFMIYLGVEAFKSIIDVREFDKDNAYIMSSISSGLSKLEFDMVILCIIESSMLVPGNCHEELRYYIFEL